MDYKFCGTLFRGIENPTHLSNFRAIRVRSSDIFFASLGPSGTAKTPAMNLIKTLTGSTTISGHTEFGPWTNANNPALEKLNITGRRLIGTHVAFEYLPEEALTKPMGEQPCSVVYLVREPKENFAAAALFQGGTQADIGPLVEGHVNGAKNLGEGKFSYPYGGYAAYANGYAAAVGGESSGGPKVFLLSQTRLADPNLNTVAAEVKRLATFLELTDYVENASAPEVGAVQTRAAAAIGDVSLMGEESACLTGNTFACDTVDESVTQLYSA